MIREKNMTDLSKGDITDLQDMDRGDDITDLQDIHKVQDIR